jgi:hypothetical protein
MDGRPAGLVYESVWGLMREMGMPRERRMSVFPAVQVMEHAVLQLLADRAKPNG